MPEYIYEHPETGEKITVWQTIHEAHEYEVDGVAYNRVYTVCLLYTSDAADE